LVQHVEGVLVIETFWGASFSHRSVQALNFVMDAFVKDVDEIGRQRFVQPGDLDFIGGGKRGIDIDGTLFQCVQESVQVFSFDVQTQRAVDGVGFDDETIRVRQDFAQFGQVGVQQGQGPHD
jgi:hypothetical protein